MTNQYNPDAVSHPGETLKDVLEERKINPEDLKLWSFNISKYIPAQRIIDGKFKITRDIAIQLEDKLAVDADFWLERQRRYDEWKDKK